jgi:hypothetical protein
MWGAKGTFIGASEPVLRRIELQPSVEGLMWRPHAGCSSTASRPEHHLFIAAVPDIYRETPEDCSL